MNSVCVFVEPDIFAAPLKTLHLGAFCIVVPNLFDPNLVSVTSVFHMALFYELWLVGFVVDLESNLYIVNI